MASNKIKLRIEIVNKDAIDDAAEVLDYLEEQGEWNPTAKEMWHALRRALKHMEARQVK